MLNDIRPTTPPSEYGKGRTRRTRTRRERTWVVMIALSAAATAAAQSTEAPPHPLPSVALPPALARVLTDYEAAWGSRDARALAALFAEDGFVLPNGRPAVRGRAEIERYYTGQGGPLSLRAFAFAVEAPVGYILGGYTSRKGEPDDGKFTLTLRREPDGRWLIASDMDNGNARKRE